MIRSRAVLPPDEVPTATDPATANEVKPARILLPSPIGNLGIELRGSALTRIALSPAPRERRQYVPLAKMEESELLDEVIGRLSEYLAGVRTQLELEYDLGPSGVDAFARRVLRETTRIPFGRTRTYKEVATAVGRPMAYRQVVAILLANPLPIVLPCHRVIPGKAGIGGYVGGEAKKRWLLRLERNYQPPAA